MHVITSLLSPALNVVEHHDFATTWVSDFIRKIFINKTPLISLD